MKCYSCCMYEVLLMSYTIAKPTALFIYTVLMKSMCLCSLLLTVVGLLCIILLSCLYLCYLMCIVLLCMYCCHTTLVAGLLARSQYLEGPATSHLGRGFSWFPCLKANAEMVPKTPSCYCMLFM